MATLNVSHMIGRLTGDPEVKTLASGKTVAKFRLAVGRGKKQADGTWTNDDTLYIDCEAWHNPDQKRNMPSVIQQYLHKGDPVYVQGALREDQWTDATSGQKRSKMKLVLDGVEFLGGKGGGDESARPQSQARGGGYDPPTDDMGGEPDPSIPF